MYSSLNSLFSQDWSWYKFFLAFFMHCKADSLLFGWNMKLAHIILLYLTRVTFQVFLVCRTENSNSWPMRSWRKATVNILEHQSTRSWWNLDKQEHVKYFDSDHINSLGCMIEVLSFIGKNKQTNKQPKNFTLNTSFQQGGLIRINPLPLIDKHLTSPYNITSESHMEVIRIKETICNKKSSWLLKKFSLSAPLKMNREAGPKLAKNWYQLVWGPDLVFGLTSIYRWVIKSTFPWNRYFLLFLVSSHGRLVLKS